MWHSTGLLHVVQKLEYGCNLSKIPHLVWFVANRFFVLNSLTHYCSVLKVSIMRGLAKPAWLSASWKFYKTPSYCCLFLNAKLYLCLESCCFLYDEIPFLNTLPETSGTSVEGLSYPASATEMPWCFPVRITTEFLLWVLLIDTSSSQGNREQWRHISSSIRPYGQSRSNQLNDRTTLINMWKICYKKNV